MNLNDIIRKVTSRKWLTSIAGIAVGFAMVFGAEESKIMDIAGAITMVSSILGGVGAETVVDVSRIKAEASVSAEKEKANATIPVYITYNESDGAVDVGDGGGGEEEV